MFTSLPEPPAARVGELRALRLSLNTPVVSITELPVGPAAAAIAVLQHAGRRELLLALRSVRTDQTVFFAPRDGGRDASHPVLAVEFAVQFAEALGFLFDEDLVQGHCDLRDAARRWSEFLAEPSLEEAREAAGTPAPRAPDGLLSKFRLAEARPAAEPPQVEDWRHDEVWVRLLGRY